MRNIVKNIFPGSILFLLLFSCERSLEGNNLPPANHGFIKYTIRAGKHYSDQNDFRHINYAELKFIVRFDSSAIYQTISPENQEDINKLYGFSDNNEEHHLFSARIGWRWSDGALRLFSYVYNNGTASFTELGTTTIGNEDTCSIKVNGSSYIFKVNNITKIIPRASTTATAIGYQLYPYFGGDEAAPHDIYIRIKEL